MSLPISDSRMREEALDVSRSFIVQAPAGSGKTTLLTQRILKLLTIAPQPESILAVTFTRKAAREMRHRVLAALKKGQSASSGETDEMTYSLAQAVLKRDAKAGWHLLRNPHRLVIVTMDAFCAMLTRQIPLLSLGEGGGTLVEYARPFYQEAVDRLLASWQTLEVPCRKALLAFALHYDNRLDKLSSLLVTLLSKRDQWLPHLQRLRGEHSAIREWLCEVRYRLISHHLQILRKRLQAVDPALVTVWLQEAGNRAEKGYHTSLWSRFQTSFRLPEADPEEMAVWLALVEWSLSKTGTFRRALGKEQGFWDQAQATREAKARLLEVFRCLSLEEGLSEALHELRLLPEAGFEERQAPLLQAMGELLLHVAAHLKVVFQEAGKMDFVEMLLAAQKALQEADAPTDLALALDYHIHHILIDEYQDTSMMQYRLFSRLVAGWAPTEGKTLFLVGDPMQSIYRFRGAEVSVFLYTQSRGLGDIALIPLQLEVNFRSESSVLRWINQHFSQIFPRGADCFLGRVPYASAVAYHADTAATVDCFWLAEALQTEKVITLIQNRLTEPYQIAVLVSKRKQLFPLMTALRQKKIPFVAREVVYLADKPHVSDLLSLAKATSDLTDRIAWLALMRSPWLGLTLSDLLKVVESEKSPLLWETLCVVHQEDLLGSPVRKRLTHFVTVIAYWLTHRGRLPWISWLRGLWGMLGGLSGYDTETDVADIEQVFQIIGEYAEETDALFKIEARLSEWYGDSRQRGVANAHVELMTIHKAKGLEFDVVILPYLEAQPKPLESEGLLWTEWSSPEGGEWLFAAKEEKTPFSFYHYVREKIKQKAYYESMRLFYVGVTRAKKQLFLLGSPSEGRLLARDSFLGMLQTVMPLKGEERRASSFEKASTDLPQIYYRLGEAWQLPLALSSVWEQRETLALESAPEPSSWEARMIGTLFHRMIQRVLQDPNRWQASLAHYLAPCRTLLTHYGLPLEDYHRLEKALSHCFEDPRGRWLLAPHQDPHCEWRLLTKTDSGIKTYVIDYSFVDEKKVRWIVDFKLTHHLTFSESILIEEVACYRAQLRQYRKLVRRLEKRKVRCALYFPLAKQWWEMEEI